MGNYFLAILEFTVLCSRKVLMLEIAVLWFLRFGVFKKFFGSFDLGVVFRGLGWRSFFFWDSVRFGLD